MRNPDFLLFVDDKNIDIQKFRSSIKITDDIGFVCDTCEIELVDPKDEISLPSEKAIFSVKIGYKDDFISMGNFSFDGWGYRKGQISLNASRHFTNSKFSDTGNLSFPSGIKLGDLVQKIAEKVGFSTIDCSEKAKSILTEPISQNFETYRNFLARICEDNEAFLKINGNDLIVRTKGEGKNFEIVPSDIFMETFAASKAQKQEEGTFKANFFNNETFENDVISIGSGNPIKKLKGDFQTKEAAEKACKMAQAKVKKNLLKISFSMNGKAEIRGDSVLKLKDFRDEINGEYWVNRVEHVISPEFGFISTINAQNL